MNLFGEDFLIDVQENTVKDLVKKLSGKNGEEVSSEKLLKSKKLTLEERLNIITDKVLNDINFDVKSGQVAVLLGKSGAGKTTILRCINGLEEFDSGEIVVDNCVIKNKNHFSRSYCPHLQDENTANL